VGCERCRDGPCQPHLTLAECRVGQILAEHLQRQDPRWVWIAMPRCVLQARRAERDRARAYHPAMADAQDEVARPLSGARAKVGRARQHVVALRESLREAGQGEPYKIPIVQDRDDATGILYLRVGHLEQHPEEWGIALGDAIHNYRSALDHAWWQMACDHLGREPTEKEAKQIQFPIVDLAKWNDAGVVKWVGQDATDAAREMQPDQAAQAAANEVHPLAALHRLSNVDKHRTVHPAVCIVSTMSLRVQRVGTTDNRSDVPLGEVHHFEAPPAEGDPLVTAPADSVLQHPDYRWEADQYGVVAVEGVGDVLAMLVAIDAWVVTAIQKFESIRG
jgi:hypothetical protein